MASAIDPTSTPGAEGGYAQAALVVDASRWLHVSGQIPMDNTGRVPISFEAQCRLAWHNVTETLSAADMAVTDLVKVTTYLSDRAHAETNSRVRREILGDHRPALTVVVAGIYDEGWLLEIEAVAASD